MESYNRDRYLVLQYFKQIMLTIFGESCLHTSTSTSSPSSSSTLQVSSINRVLRNLASQTQKNEMNPYIMDKFGLLNGQAWPRPNPWYANPALPGMGYPQQYSQPPPPPVNPPTHEKKGEFEIYICKTVIIS